MIGMTAFRTISHEFACFAEWHGGGGRSTARRRDKRGDPGGSQVIDMARLPPGASVGSRAARKKEMRFLNSHSGTGLSETPGGPYS